MEHRTTAMDQAIPIMLPNTTALLLDQTSVVSLVMRGAMEDAGLRTVPRRSLDQLEGFLKHGSYGMVVLAVNDIEHTLIEAIEQIREVTDAPVMVVSDTEDMSMRIAAFEAGADEHIDSSIGRREIAARIRAKLRRSFTYTDYRTAHTR